MKNIIICGLGAVGLTYGGKFRGKCEGKCEGKSNLRILVDEARLKRYTENKPVLNGVEQNFEYILPQDEFDADLIIISTKASGLASAIEQIRNFVKPET